MTVQGLHHITIVCADAQRTVDFYTRVLGLRLVKKTVNFDDPSSYHLYFGDETGRPGTAITFFEWPGAPKGQWGIGGTHHFALQVADYDGLLKWKRRLTDLGLPVDGPLDRHYFTSIYFNDPDGTILEIATRRPGLDDRRRAGPHRHGVPRAAAGDAGAQPRRGAHRGRDLARAGARDHRRHGAEPGHAPHHRHRLRHRAHPRLLRRPARHAAGQDDLELRRPRPRRTGTGASATAAPARSSPTSSADAAKERRMRMGAGQTHHFALAVPDEATQLEWREKLVQAGLRVSPVMDRIYFKSIYTNDPDGHIVELATVGPGFTVDEDLATLGTELKLPPWLENDRERIESHLRPIVAPEWRSPGTA